MGKRQIIAGIVGCAVELPAVALRCPGAGVSIGSCRLCSGPSCMGMLDSLLHGMQKDFACGLVRHLSNDGSSGWAEAVPVSQLLHQAWSRSRSAARPTAGPAREPALPAC